MGNGSRCSSFWTSSLNISSSACTIERPFVRDEVDGSEVAGAPELVNGQRAIGSPSRDLLGCLGLGGAVSFCALAVHLFLCSCALPKACFRHVRDPAFSKQAMPPNLLRWECPSKS